MSHTHDPSHYVATHGNSTAVTHFHAWRTAENSASYLLPYLKPDMKILDVGQSFDIPYLIPNSGQFLTGFLFM